MMAPASPRHRQPLRNRVYSNHSFRSQQEGASDSHLANWPASPYRDRVSGLDVAEICRHVAGRENVRQEEHLLIRQVVGNLQGSDISKRHTKNSACPPL